MSETTRGSSGANDRKLVEEIFQLAADLAGDERAQMLQEKCAGRPEIRAQVESILREFDDGTKGILASSPVAPASSAMGLPQTIGDYRIVKELGRGGMGVVYQAEQQSPRRTVALKVMRWDVLSPTGIKRFRREAEVLGQLKHPGIAQIYELGMVTMDGREQPFIAMEFVEGPNLVEYCTRHALGVEDRLRLIGRLCEAVQYAHGRGVIHRDLKPGNVLVEQYAQGGGGASELGQPKILDFGIARATEGETRSATLETQVGQIVGTLAYMSPEQASGNPHAIDARCDVYALGAIAYELLTGRLPLEVSGKTLPEAMRIVLENDPPTLRTVVPGLKGDVDAIIGKALEKQVARRYQSAAEFGADIGRYLRGEAVQARPASTAYQLSKFARRNKALVGGVAAVMVALAGGLATTLVMYMRVLDEREVAKREADRATREAERVTAIRDYLLDDMIGSAAPERDGYDVKVVDVLKKSAGKIEERFGHVPELEMDVRSLIADTFRRLGMREETLEQQQARLDYWMPKAKEEPFKAASAYGGMATALNMAGRPEDAEQAARAGLKLLEESPPEDASAVPMLKVSLGASLHVQRKYAEAEPMLREAVEAMERARGKTHDQTLVAMSQLAACLYAQRRFDEALAYSKEHLVRAEAAYGAYHPATLAARNGVVIGLLSQGQTDEAWEFAKTIPDAAIKTFPEGHPLRAIAISSAGMAAFRAKKFPEAEDLLMRGHELTVSTFGAGSYEVEKSTSNIRDLYREMKDDARATEWGRKALQMRLRVAGPGEFDSLAKGVQQLDTDLRKRKLPEGTLEVLDWIASAAEEAAPPGDRSRSRYFGNVGRILVAFDRLDKAELMLLEAEKALGTAGVDPRAEVDNRRIVYSALMTLAQIRGNKEQEAKHRAELEKIKNEQSAPKPDAPVKKS